MSVSTGSQAGRPAARQVGTWQQAEELAVDWMRWFGFADARLTNAGPDGGIDVTAGSALGQVKFKASQVGAPELQRLYGARAARTEKSLLFFTGTSYSKSAVDYAANNSIALFIYSLVGEVSPVNSHARSLFDAAERPAAYDPAPAGGAAGDARPPRTGGGVDGTGPAQPGGPPTLQGSVKRSPVARGAIAAALLFVPATLILVGFGALTQSPEHPGAALQVGLLGVVAYAVALWLIAGVTKPVRRRGRVAGVLLVLFIAAAGIALWIGLAFTLDAGTGGRAPLLLICFAMLVPLVALGLWRPANPIASTS